MTVPAAREFEPGRLRRLLLLVVIIGIAGLIVELALLDHFETVTQWIPMAALWIGLPPAVVSAMRPARASVRVLEVVMVMFVIVGLAGIYFHIAGNIEFARERDSDLRGMAFALKVLRGATPALAPAAIAQLGLSGLLYCYRHPARSTTT